MTLTLRKVFLAVGLFTSSIALSATTEFQGKVSEVQFYGNGMMLVLGLTIADQQATLSCNGSQSGFVIASDHGQRNELLSILLTAKTTQTDISVKNVDIPSSCWAPVFSSNSYLIF